MSETDDTDDLLLIPPDRFVIQSDSGDSEEPYFRIVNGIVQQLGDLKDRIHSLETSSLNSNLETIFDSLDNMQHTSSRFNRFDNADEIYIPQSTQSTPQKPHTKFHLNSLPNSPNIDRTAHPKNGRGYRVTKSPIRTNIFSSNRRPATVSTSPEKDDRRTFNEIDTFLSKVKTIQRINASRGLEKEFDENNTGRNENNSEEKEIKNNPEVLAEKEQTWRQGDNRESVPDYGTGARDTLYTNCMQDKSQSDYKDGNNFVNKVAQGTTKTWETVDRYSDSSSDLTQTTAYDKFSKYQGDLLTSPIHTNALNIINMHKKLLENEAPIVGLNKNQQSLVSNTIGDGDNLALLSLADIWNSNSLKLNSSQMSQKFQEEHMRRRHCEELIHELQNRTLELQQKLSVAVKVDDVKNNTIRQFQEALETIVGKLEGLNKEKQEWDQKIRKIEEKHAQELEEASQKIAYYEKEASKARNLAHGNQDKLISLEKRCSDLQSALQSLEHKCRDLEEYYAREVERNQQLSEVLSQKEIELNEKKNTLNEAMAEVTQSKKTVEVCQSEFGGIKNECMKLQKKLKDGTEQIMLLTEQKTTLLMEIEQYKRHQKELDEEREQFQKKLEIAQMEYKNFYQGQLEALVASKVKEYEKQVEQAWKACTEEINKKQLSMTTSAVMHVQKVTEQCNDKIKLVEEKHNEEIKLLEAKHLEEIKSCQLQTEKLQSKVDEMQIRNHNIVRHIQKIMKSQWTETQKILSSMKSPVSDEIDFSTLDQLNSLTTRSYNNVEEVLAQHQEEPCHVARKSRKETAFKLPSKGTSSSVANHFEINLQEAYGATGETPVSSKGQTGKYSQSDIQKYISLVSF
ncbi:hypothetical protein NQ317_003114, partial [Molorchus minor]